MKSRVLAPFQVVIFLCAGMACLGACAVYEKPEIMPPVLNQDLSLLAPEDFPGMIAKLEDIAGNHENPSVRTQAHYYAALAHVHFNNPAPDYSRALGNLDAYMAIDTELPDKNKGEIAVWQSVFSQMVITLQGYEKLQNSYARLRQQYRSTEENREFLGQQIEDLAKTIERQRKEIAGLEDKIKKLDALHAEIEKKKKKK